MSPLSPTPTVSSSNMFVGGAHRPMSAMAQPVSTMSSLQGNNNNNSGYAANNGYVPTPFTQTATTVSAGVMPNGHALDQSQGQQQYYWSNQQYPQH